MSVTTTPWFVLNSPELGRPFADFCESCKNSGVLDRRTKELLMVALASVFRCRPCLEEHIMNALEAGVSKEELTEALLLAAVEGAGSQLEWQKDLRPRGTKWTQRPPGPQQPREQPPHLTDEGTYQAIISFSSLSTQAALE